VGRSVRTGAPPKLTSSGGNSDENHRLGAVGARAARFLGHGTGCNSGNWWWVSAPQLHCCCVRHLPPTRDQGGYHPPSRKVHLTTAGATSLNMFRKKRGEGKSTPPRRFHLRQPPRDYDADVYPDAAKEVGKAKMGFRKRTPEASQKHAARVKRPKSHAKFRVILPSSGMVARGIQRTGTCGPLSEHTSFFFLGCCSTLWPFPGREMCAREKTYQPHKPPFSERRVQA
jgi:hypothetical protein